MINTNLLYLDFSTWLGIVILLLFVLMAIILFFFRSYGFCGLILIFLGLLLVFNGINLLFALIPFITGVIIAFRGGS